MENGNIFTGPVLIITGLNQFLLHFSDKIFVILQRLHLSDGIFSQYIIPSKQKCNKQQQNTNKNISQEKSYCLLIFGYKFSFSVPNISENFMRCFDYFK